MFSLTVGGVPIGAAGRSSLSPLSSFPTTQLALLPPQLGFFSAHPIFKACTRNSTCSFKTAVASIDSNQLSPSPNPPEKEEEEEAKVKKYYFVVANAKFMLDEEEHFKELMFERLRYYGERDKEQDFWLVIEPKFLDNFPNITKRLRRPAVALVSTNGPWITFMKLRLDRVLSDSYESDSVEEALASNPATLEFEKPEKWLAPYSKYEYGWWEPFLPTASKESKV